MTDIEKRLVQFARLTLTIMQEADSWDSDTMQAIADAAHAGKIMRRDVSFEALPEVFE